MVKTYIKDIIEDIAHDYPTVTPFWKNYAKDANIGYYVMLRVLRSAVNWLDIRRPAFIQQDIQGNYAAYEFVDNFDQYIQGIIPERQLELVPTSIIRVGVNGAWTSADYWDYREPILYGGFPATIEYTITRRIVANQAADGWFTEDSAIYFMEEWDEDFHHYFNNCIGMVINEAKKSVNFGGVEFLSYLDTLLQQYDSEVKRSEASDLVLLRLWRG